MNLKEVNRQFDSGKTAHDPSLSSKDDEDKGSSLQDEVNRLSGSNSAFVRRSTMYKTG